MPVSKLLRHAAAGAALAAVAFSLPVRAEEAKVLATVDGEQITTADVEYAKKNLGDSLSQVPAGAQQTMIVDLLIESQLIANAARKAGVADGEEYKRQMRWLEAQALREAYINERTAEMVSDEEIKAKYDEARAQVSEKKEIQARHILLKTKEEADAVIAELDKGADFAELAKSKSTGPTGPRGGDLGYFGEGRMVPEFEKAAFALEKGAYTKEPVQTQFGWHVIKKEDERQMAFPELDQVKDRIKVALQAEKLQGIIKELREAAKIEMPAQ
jgi:peptidyl-prolyl cis-trans isomerase C